MNLIRLVRKHPNLFLPQDWYADEDFAWRDRGSVTTRDVPTFTPLAAVNGQDSALPFATELAACYAVTPLADVWQRFIWCADTDHLGQRIYVGGVSDANGRRFEVHRHLVVTSKWGVVVW